MALQIHTIDSPFKDQQHVKCRTHRILVDIIFVKKHDVIIVEYI